MAIDLLPMGLLEAAATRVLSQISILWVKFENLLSEIQRLTDAKTLEKATLRQNALRFAVGQSDGALPVSWEGMVGGWLGDCRSETPEGTRQQAGLVVQGHQRATDHKISGP
jgi:hypothetical protein